jgi:hypothetical protein
MQFISCHDGKLQTLSGAAATAGLKASPTRSFVTGLDALDALAPQQRFARGAMHELLFEQSDGQPKFVAAMIAQAAASSHLLPLPLKERAGVRGKRVKSVGEVRSQTPNACGIDGRMSATRLGTVTPHPNPLAQGERGPEMPVIWSDPRGEVYPPALASLGFDLSKVYLLHPQSAADESWAVTECLRCRGVSAVIAAAPERLSRIEARRFQLAAERGGTVGILLRQRGRGESVYAAATRWLVAPHPGERTIQRWKIQLLHGHGGRVGQTVFLEYSRENHSVRAVEKLAERPAASTAAQRAIA